jgi:hypothetical protein
VAGLNHFVPNLREIILIAWDDACFSIKMIRIIFDSIEYMETGFSCQAKTIAALILIIFLSLYLQLSVPITKNISPVTFFRRH